MVLSEYLKKGTVLGGVAQVVECLLSKCKALSLTPHYYQKDKNKIKIGSDCVSFLK
jgi:hypothetical protein